MYTKIAGALAGMAVLAGLAFHQGNVDQVPGENGELVMGAAVAPEADRRLAGTDKVTPLSVDDMHCADRGILNGDSQQLRDCESTEFEGSGERTQPGR